MVLLAAALLYGLLLPFAIRAARVMAAVSAKMHGSRRESCRRAGTDP
jgi:hypothetical protein